MIRVMVVDDSPLVRKIASDILNGDSGVRVECTASNAEIALARLDRSRPDVITMDMEMPGIGGLQALREIMRRRPTPVIVLSSHARRGAELTLQALEAGAVDFMLKPTATPSGGLDAVARELVEKVKSASATQPHGISLEAEAPRTKPTGPGPARRLSLGSAASYEIVAIGTSTGGPVALKTVLAGLAADFPLPIVVVQHMPPVFTRAFAERLNATCALTVKEAATGDPLLPGQVLIAAGDFHLTVSHSEHLVTLNQRDPVSGHRPSVDVLMRSVAREYGSRAVGVIMTGMGKDGADGIRELHHSGGRILAQDKVSSVIYGMNREVIMNGDADDVLGVSEIPKVLTELACVGACV